MALGGGNSLNTDSAGIENDAACGTVSFDFSWDETLRIVKIVQTGTVVARHHSDPSPYKSSDETSCYLEGKTNEILGDDCWPYTNTGPPSPRCLLAPPHSNKTADNWSCHEGYTDFHKQF